MKLTRSLCVAALCTFGVLLGASSAQAQQTKLLPSDTEMIATLNLQQILKSELVKENKVLFDGLKDWLTKQLDDKGISKSLKKADFDPFRDLNSVTFAVPGNRDPKEAFFILVEGKFDADKIDAAVNDAGNDAGVKAIQLAGVKAYEVSPKDEKTVYIGILNKKTLIVTAVKADFIEAVGRLNGTRQADFKAEFKALLEAVTSKQSLSAIATSAALAKISENAPQGGGAQGKAAMGALKQLDGMSFAMTIQRNIDFQLGLNTKDNKTATEYANLGNLFITGARANFAEKAKNDARIAPAVEVLNTLRATAQGNSLILRGQISYETLGKLLANLPPLN